MLAALRASSSRPPCLRANRQLRLSHFPANHSVLSVLASAMVNTAAPREPQVIKYAWFTAHTGHFAPTFNSFWVVYEIARNSILGV